MNIVQVGTDLHILDKTTRTYARMKAYAEVLGDLRIIIPVTEKSFQQISDGPLRVYPVYAPSKILALFVLHWRLTSMLNADSIVYAQDPFEIGLMAYLSAVLRHCKFVVQVHTDFLSPYFARESLRRKFQVPLARFLVKRAYAVRVVSERIKNSLVKGVGVDEGKLFVLPILFDSPAIQPTREVGKGDSISFLVLSRFVVEKRVDLVIEAFRELKKITTKKISLTIAGDGPLKSQLEKLASSDPDIHFIGWQKNLSTAYTNADCLVLASMYEGYSLNILEAAGYGVPSIMTDVGCAGEFLIHNENGVVIPIGDKQALVDAMKYVVTNPNQLTLMGSKGREKLIELSNPEAYLLQLKRMFEQISLEEKRPA